MKNPYAAVVQWSDEDECFIARYPELEAVIAHGDSKAEALEQLETAFELYVETSETGSPDPSMKYGSAVWEPGLKNAIEELLLGLVRERDWFGVQLDFEYGNISDQQLDEAYEKFCESQEGLMTEERRTSIRLVLRHLDRVPWSVDLLSTAFGTRIDDTNSEVKSFIKKMLSRRH